MTLPDPNITETPHFPLAAVVGADDLKLALCLTAIDPRIGGVLIEGPRGMAKSTLARGLADVLASGQFVTLPLGATEERLVGTLDLDAALAEGRAQFSPGVLAKADGGVLYVDEVNLLADHLVDLLLDVAASGVNMVERDGISHRHAARFVLIGTMNPEEGELRPQLLDRFGLNVALSGQTQPAERSQIIRRRLDFDSDPVMFCQQWQAQQDALKLRCEQARQLLAGIELDDHSLAMITERCFAAGVDGMRADLVWLRAARAHAAWRGAGRIEEQDIEAVAEFALRHRRRASRPRHHKTRKRRRPDRPAGRPTLKAGRATGASCPPRPSLPAHAAKCRAGQKSLRHPPSYRAGGGCRSPSWSTGHWQTRGHACRC
ncbi:Magnesium chelatase [Pseudomonas savastanoi pv. retacarpa]|nr:Magnesium chelatase [Pseudomonas savastanoi pv. retacarpa]